HRPERIRRRARCSFASGESCPTFMGPLMRLRTWLVGVVALGALLAAPGAGTGSTTLPRLHPPWDLKVVSYFRVDAGWTKMWTDWQPDRVDADLARAASLGANTVRAILQPDTFGFPHVSQEYA